MSWKPEVMVSGKWSQNALVFETKKEAEKNAEALFHRWTATTNHRAVESDKRVNYKYVNGVLERLKYITVFHTDGRVEDKQVEIPEKPQYKDIKKIVEPIIEGDLEHVSVLWSVDEDRPKDTMRALDMFVDENGFAKGLARNEKATEVYRNNWLTRHPGVDPESVNHVVGTAVLFHDKVWS